MFDIISTVHKRSVDPFVDTALSTVDWKDWYPTHVAMISAVMEGMLSNFRDRAFYFPHYSRHFYFDHKWKKIKGGGFSLELDQGRGTIFVFPMIGLGWCIFVKCDCIRAPRCRLFHALVVADGTEAVLCASTADIAKKLAVSALQRATTGNCPAPMPGIGWRGLPVGYWVAAYDDPKTIVTPLESDQFNFRATFETNTTVILLDAQVDVLITFGGQIFQRSFKRSYAT